MEILTVEINTATLVKLAREVISNIEHVFQNEGRRGPHTASLYGKAQEINTIGFSDSRFITIDIATYNALKKIAAWDIRRA